MELPMSPGDIIAKAVQVIEEHRGCGTYSTSWLCRTVGVAWTSSGKWEVQQNILFFAKVCTILRQDNLVDGRGHVVGRHGRIIVYRILNQDTATSALSSTPGGISQEYSEQHQSFQDIEREKKGKNPNKTWKGQGAHISSYFIIFPALHVVASWLAETFPNPCQALQKDTYFCTCIRISPASATQRFSNS